MTAEGPMVTLGGLLRAGPVGAALSAIGNVALYFGAQALDLPLRVPDGGAGGSLAPLALPAVIVASVMPAFAAAIVLALLPRFTRDPFRVFRVLAVALLVLSCVPVLLLDAAFSTKLILVAMHGVSAWTITWALLRMGATEG